MKRMIALILAATLLSFSLCACSSSTDDKETSETKVENIAGYDFEVPETWEDGENTDDLQYYYPENGMLMVAYQPSDQSLSDENLRNEFISGFMSEMESAEINSESETTISNTTAYQYDLDVSIDGESWASSFVIFNGNDGVIGFFMATRKDSGNDYSSDFESVLDSIKSVNNSASAGEATAENDSETAAKNIEVNPVQTKDGLLCVFITNKNDFIVDELSVQINFKDENGTTIDTDDDAHDMVLPGSTVVSRIEAPSSYSDFEVVKNVELGAHPSYENHSEDIAVNSNQGEDCIIVEFTNNSSVDIEELEYIAVLYNGNDIATVSYPQDVMDIASGSTITEKIDTYSEEYDRFEIYLNQAHTFGL